MRATHLPTFERKIEDMTKVAQAVNENTQGHGWLVEVTPFEWPETPELSHGEAKKIAETRIYRLVMDQRRQAKKLGLI